MTWYDTLCNDMIRHETGLIWHDMIWYDQTWTVMVGYRWYGNRYTHDIIHIYIHICTYVYIYTCVKVHVCIYIYYIMLFVCRDLLQRGLGSLEWRALTANTRQAEMVEVAPGQYQCRPDAVLFGPLFGPGIQFSRILVGALRFEETLKQNARRYT